MPAHRARVRAGRRVRRHPQQLRLPAADLQRPGRDACPDDDPRVLVAADPRRCTSATTRRCAYVAISDADRHPSLDYLATIHHGIDTDAFALHPAPGRYLLFFGRIHPDKGTVEAIDVAERCGLPLVDGRNRPGPPLLRASWSLPRIDGDTRSASSARSGRRARCELLGGARALLHLIGFDEPFGYSVVEAMACGTPVIAFRRGSMPELIVDGTTGFLVDDVDGAVAAVEGRACARPSRDPCARGGAVRPGAHGRRVSRRLRTRDRVSAADPEMFRLGVNYWPAEVAMAWLPDYDPAVTRRDFGRAASAGFDNVRVFVRWEDVQPTAVDHRRRGSPPARRRRRRRGRGRRRRWSSRSSSGT